MTILTQTNKNEYIANGSMNAFEYTYIVLDAAHMAVYLDGSPLVGGYSVSGVGSPTGGTVTLNAAPAVGVVVTLLREVPLIQQTDYTEYDAFPAETHERALDKLTQITQQLTEADGRQLSRAPGRPNWDAQGRRITNVADPVDSNDAANKSFADGIVEQSLAQADRAEQEADRAANEADSAQQSAAFSAASAAIAQQYPEGQLAAALAVPDSTVLVGGVEAGDLASAYNKRRVDIRDFGIVFDGSDEGPKLRMALATGVPLYFPPNKTITVNFDPASAFDDGGVTRYSRCIAIPSNADLMFGSNFKIKGADGLQNWTRVVVMENVQNIKIHGALFVDGNVQNVGTPNNEHMHCVFMFNVKNTEIDTIHGINARGDNVFIGGSDEITFSDNVRIGSVIGTTAGRKNLVLHMVDNLHIEYALLDNSAGGAAVYGGVPDDTDKHCLDLEPDEFTASKVFRQYIGNLRTFGLGNDFTVGITPAVADAWQLTIGEAYCRQSGPMSGAVKAWLQYGVTINVINDLQIIDCEGVNRPVFLQYAARLNVGGKIKINGSCPNPGEAMLFATAAAGNPNTPRIRATELDISSSNGGGAILRSCHLRVDTFRVSCPAFGLVLGDNVDVALHKAITKIGRLITRDTGTTYVVLADTPVLASPYLTVDEVLVFDGRGTKASAVFQIDSNNSLNFSVGLVTEASGVPLVTWVGADKYLKTSVQQYVCQGTPEGMIPAPIGSIASRRDGGAGTSFYVKQSGAGNTGWAAK